MSVLAQLREIEASCTLDNLAISGEDENAPYHPAIVLLSIYPRKTSALCVGDMSKNGYCITVALVKTENNSKVH